MTIIAGNSDNTDARGTFIAPTPRIGRERFAMGHMANRFRAIDVLRGLTLALMIVVNMQIGAGKSYAPLLHASWNGLTLTDLVFPTFMFVVGTALSFTLEKYAALGDAAVLRKIATR